MVLYTQTLHCVWLISHTHGRRVTAVVIGAEVEKKIHLRVTDNRTNSSNGIAVTRTFGFILARRYSQYVYTRNNNYYKSNIIYIYITSVLVCTKLTAAVLIRVRAHAPVGASDRKINYNPVVGTVVERLLFFLANTTNNDPSIVHRYEKRSTASTVRF